MELFEREVDALAAGLPQLESLALGGFQARWDCAAVFPRLTELVFEVLEACDCSLSRVAPALQRLGLEPGAGPAVGLPFRLVSSHGSLSTVVFLKELSSFTGTLPHLRHVQHLNGVEVAHDLDGSNPNHVEAFKGLCKYTRRPPGRTFGALAFRSSYDADQFLAIAAAEACENLQHLRVAYRDLENTRGGREAPGILDAGVPGSGVHNHTGGL